MKVFIALVGYKLNFWKYEDFHKVEADRKEYIVVKDLVSFLYIFFAFDFFLLKGFFLSHYNFFYLSL